VAKYDCAAMVLMVSPTHAEVLNDLFPTWSVMKREGNGLRFRSKREDFVTKEAQHQAAEATAHMLTSTVEWSRQLNANMRGVLEQLGRHMKIGWIAWDKPDSSPGDGK
jgi:hypothetical protein